VHDANIPPLALLSSSPSFQPYAEATVLGAARARLEGSMNDRLGGMAPAYEAAIADVRKGSPLVAGILVLQGLARLGTVAGSVAVS
jgi:hypothetical protein